MTRAVAGQAFPFAYWLPGLVATLALVLLNLVPRDALSGASAFSSDEDTEVKP